MISPEIEQVATDHVLRDLLATDGAAIATTRLRFHRLRSCLRAWWRFRTLYRDARGAPGFVRGCVMFVDAHTLMNVSIWESRRAMLTWAGRRQHVEAVQSTYGKLKEVWSADWTLRHRSPSAEQWDGSLSALKPGPFAADPRDAFVVRTMLQEMEERSKSPG